MLQTFGMSAQRRPTSIKTTTCKNSTTAMTSRKRNQQGNRPFWGRGCSAAMGFFPVRFSAGLSPVCGKFWSYQLNRHGTGQASSAKEGCGSAFRIHVVQGVAVMAALQSAARNLCTSVPAPVFAFSKSRDDDLSFERATSGSSQTRADAPSRVQATLRRLESGRKN